MTDTTQTKFETINDSFRVGRDYIHLHKQVFNAILKRSKGEHLIINGPFGENSRSILGTNCGFSMSFDKHGEDTNVDLEITDEAGKAIWELIKASEVLKERTAGALPLDLGDTYEAKLKKLLFDVLATGKVSVEYLCEKYTVEVFAIDFYESKAPDVYECFEIYYDLQRKPKTGLPFDKNFLIGTVVPSGTLRTWWTAEKAK